MTFNLHEFAVRAVPEKIAGLRLEQVLAKRTHSAHWPVNARVLNYYSARMGFMELTYDSIEILLAKGWTQSQIAPLLKSATTVFYKWGLFDWKAHMALSTKRRVQLAEWMAEWVTRLKQPPYLCEDGSNRIWTDTQAAHEAKQFHWVELETDEERRRVGHLLGQMFNYTELLFFAYHAQGHEYHGTYNISGHDHFFVDFFRLKTPTYVASQAFPYPSFRVGVRTQGYPFKIDFFQHLFANEPLPPHVRAVAVSGGPNVSNVNDLDSLIGQLDGAIGRLIEEIAPKTQDELVAQAVIGVFEGFRELYEAAGIASRIPWHITLDELKAKYGDAPAPVPVKFANDPAALMTHWTRSIGPE